MCGRLNVIDNPVMTAVFAILGIDFFTVTNHDLRPSQQVASIAAIDGQLCQLNAQWGIQPAWSKKLLINAQAETVAEKRTFKRAFATHRCVVPCSGWYEWRDEGARRKQKYLFSDVDDQCLFMAGIWYVEEEGNRLVTLTTSANAECAAYHYRMPLLIEQAMIKQWILANADEVAALLSADYADTIKIDAA